MAKRAQEEIVGFVVVVVLLAIIGVILLGVMLRAPPPVQKESQDIHQFIEAAYDYTTTCALKSENSLASLSEVLRACYKGEHCTNGLSACSALNRTLADILSTSWPTGPNRPLLGYSFNITYTTNVTKVAPTPLISLSTGNCSLKTKSAQQITPMYPGILSSELTLCYQVE